MSEEKVYQSFEVTPMDRGFVVRCRYRERRPESHPSYQHSEWETRSDEMAFSTIAEVAEFLTEICIR